jgi:hypothetical protein
MSSTRASVLVAFLLMTPACIYDGAYLVQGTVRSSAGRAVAGAEVVLRDAAGRCRARVTTAEDGSYRATYPFGGIGFLLFTPGDGDPYVEFAAPEHVGRAARLVGSDPEAGIERRACEPRARGCHGIDAVLAPVASHGPDAGSP